MTDSPASIPDTSIEKPNTGVTMPPPATAVIISPET